MEGGRDLHSHPPDNSHKSCSLPLPASYPPGKTGRVTCSGFVHDNTAICKNYFKVFRTYKNTNSKEYTLIVYDF